ncbi:photosynthetic reaction center cytochrome c subunit, partial [bacterium]|nr:photosynthetic reaction center cytochrome c subunit [bacterium]
MAQGLENTFGKKGLFWLIFGGVSLVLVGLSYWVITFVWAQVSEEEPPDVEDALSLIYVNYVVSPDDYISPESYLAMAAYQQQFPETQNVQVLSDLTTVEIIGYMINHMTAGLGVNCTYCHSLENFAADVWDDPVAMANKDMARQHLRLTGDLNQNWLTQLASLTPDKQPPAHRSPAPSAITGSPSLTPREQESDPPC